MTQLTQPVCRTRRITRDNLFNPGVPEALDVHTMLRIRQCFGGHDAVAMIMPDQKMQSLFDEGQWEPLDSDEGFEHQRPFEDLCEYVRCLLNHEDARHAALGQQEVWDQTRPMIVAKLRKNNLL